MLSLQKTATAVAHCTQGNGIIKVNGKPLHLMEPATLRYKVGSGGRWGVGDGKECGTVGSMGRWGVWDGGECGTVGSVGRWGVGDGGGQYGVWDDRECGTE